MKSGQQIFLRQTAGVKQSFLVLEQFNEKKSWREQLWMAAGAESFAQIAASGDEAGIEAAVKPIEVPDEFVGTLIGV